MGDSIINIQSLPPVHDDTYRKILLGIRPGIGLEWIKLRYPTAKPIDTTAKVTPLKPFMDKLPLMSSSKNLEFSNSHGESAGAPILNPILHSKCMEPLCAKDSNRLNRKDTVGAWAIGN